MRDFTDATLIPLLAGRTWRHSRASSLLWLAFLVAGMAGAEPLPSGSGHFVLGNEGEPIEIFSYKPAAYRHGPILVVVHGSDRNAAEYRNYAITMADRFGAIVVAPLFDAARFDDERYKRGGGVTKAGRVQPRDQWTFNVIGRLVAEVRRREAGPALPYYVIGHSGGAQFTARMAMYQPGEAVRFVAANAGSYTFPAPAVKFPYGLGGLPPELAGDDTLRRYLAAPLTLFLGTGDIKQDAADGFDSSPEAMQQGPYRLARGHNFFATMQSLAAQRGWSFNWRLVETPDIGHSGEKMFQAPEVRAALFGAEKSAAGTPP